MGVIIEVPEWSVNGFLCFLLLVIILSIIWLIWTGVDNVQKVRRREKWSTLPKDMVILHQMPRGKTIPCVVPFALKLETYLRMAGIPYENDFEEPIGPKGQCPWLSINGQDIADSQLAIEFLNQHFKRDLSKHLTPVEKGQGRAYQFMAENHLYWILPLYRVVYSNFKILQSVLRLPWYQWIFIYYTKYFINQNARGHGLGRHSQKEVDSLTEDDLHAFSKIIGNKKFLFGDQPSEYDSAIFGILAQIVWGLPGSPHEALIHGDLTNLKDYCNHMKERFWPDWEKCLRF